MTRFIECANAHAAMGQLSPEWQQAWRETYDANFSDAAETMGAEAADAAAAKATVKALDAQVKQRQRELLLQARARQRVLDGLVEFARQDKRNPNAQFAAGLKRLMENVGGYAGAPFASVQGRYRATLGQFHRMMADTIEQFEAGVDANLMRRRGAATMTNLVREAFGEDTGDMAAKALAKGWADTAEYARQVWNAAGGDVPKRKDWGLPQSHSAFAIRRAAKDPKAAKQAWIDFIKPLLEPSRMIDELTGQPISAQRLDLALSNMWDRIVSEGAVDLNPGGSPGAGRLAGRRQEHRFLAFKDADAWMAYQERFGESDSFAAMMGHLDGMARDIARLEVLGPNPDANMTWLLQEAERRGGLEEVAGQRGALKRAKGFARMAQQMYETFKGTYSTPSGEEIVAPAMGSLRGFLTAAQLGSSIISDIPSAPVFGAMQRAFTGLDKAGDVSRIVKLLNPANDADRAIARRAGFVIETATDGLTNMAYYNESWGGGRAAQAIGNKLPAAVMRVTGQAAFTAARKRAFGLEFMGAIADARGKSLADLQGQPGAWGALGRTLQRWGFTDAEWDKIRAVDLWEPDEGATFLRGAEIEAAHGRELAMRYMEMIQQETIRAVPENTLYARTHLLGGTQAGTFWGEVLRSVGMYRGFSVTMTYVWGQELAASMAVNGVPRGATQAAALITGLVVAGGVAIQMREIAKGNEPRRMDDPAFWGSALMQSGGLGIFGDFFGASESRAGGGAAMAAFGPVGQLGADLAQTANHSVAAALNMDQVPIGTGQPRPGRQVANLAARYTPVSSLWFMRAAWDRAVIDSMRRAIDPDYEEWAGLRRKRLADQGRDYWWAPGGAPDPGELLDGSQPGNQEQDALEGAPAP